MAPDLNSVPPSTRPPATQQDQHHSSSSSGVVSPGHRRPSTSSRRASQIFPMSPPPLPLAMPAGASSPNAHQAHQPFPPLSPHMAAHGRQDGEPGVPMRHPRPLTAAELHLELEQEQEAVVNRLTRELSALRAHSASVASTASVSSTSTSATHPSAMLFEATDPSTAHAGALTGPTHPTIDRRHRSSSSVSRGSVSAGAGAGVGNVQMHTPGSGRLPHRYSVGGGGQSQSQAPQQIPQTPHTPQTPQQQGGDSVAGSANTWLSNSTGGGGFRSPGLSGGARFEEVALHKMELEEAKRENDGLRKRIRELEVELRGRRSSGGSVERVGE